MGIGMDLLVLQILLPGCSSPAICSRYGQRTNTMLTAGTTTRKRKSLGDNGCNGALGLVMILGPLLYSISGPFWSNWLGHDRFAVQPISREVMLGGSLRLMTIDCTCKNEVPPATHECRAYDVVVK